MSCGCGGPQYKKGFSTYGIKCILKKMDFQLWIIIIQYITQDVLKHYKDIKLMQNFIF